MDDPLCLRALESVSVYMGHDIMADKLLSRFCFLEVDILRMGF